MIDLAQAIAGQGRYGEAERWCVEALGMQRRLLGRDHHLTLQSMSVLAELYRATGKVEQAKELEAEAESVRKRVEEKAGSEIDLSGN
jgi:hypothetical protein